MLNGRCSSSKSSSQNGSYCGVDEDRAEWLNSLLPHTKEAGPIYECVGDAYEAQPIAAEAEWEVNDRATRPYLEHIRNLQSAWPHLRYLRQWMEVTTSPIKWPQMKEVRRLRPELFEERASRTKVAVVDFKTGIRPIVHETITKVGDLGQSLNEPIPQGVHRLYIVEDLSRDVIEQLGSKLDIDPLFFREHINDYWWYNTRDPWVELPDLDIYARERLFYRLTYVQPRYFKSKEDLKTAKKQAGQFNVLRRLDDDSEHKAMFDDNNSTVALVRSKATFWMKRSKEPNGQDTDGHVGVLLVDPSITEGYPLWQGYRPFKNSPTPKEAENQKFQYREKQCLFDDLIFWLKDMSNPDIEAIDANPQVMMFRMAQIICSEWLILVRYIMARLGQIEWELERPDFRLRPDDIDMSLKKLHTWRRRLPLYKIMVEDAENKLFRDNKLKPDDCMKKLKPDFDILARAIDDVSERMHRIATVGLAVTSIEESRRAMEQNSLVGRLTYLAVFFAPLSFISSFFSMTGDLSGLSQTFWIYFVIAVPVTAMVFWVIRPRFMHYPEMKKSMKEKMLWTEIFRTK